VVNVSWEDELWFQAERTEENTDKIHPRKAVFQPEFRPDIQMVKYSAPLYRQRGSAQAVQPTGVVEV